MSLLKLENIQLTYKLSGQTLQVLSQVDLEVARGEMIGILGPSGSGKSTLLYILGCLLKPTSGFLEFAGLNVSTLSRDRLAELRSREIGFVFQQFHLLPRANLIENVLLATRYLQDDPRSAEQLNKKARSLLDSVGLSSHLDHKPNQLSGGQQQRVAIARALMNDPALILADEPTGNLDSKSAGQVLDLLRDIQKTGRTVIIITHDQEVARRCDRIVSIKDGVMQGGLDGPKSLVVPVAPKTERPRVSEKALSRAVNVWHRYGRAAVSNLLRNKSRSFLTMLGVTIGIAAVLSTITLGSYTRGKILETYENLGVNKLIVRAYPKWNLQAKDIRGPSFEGVSQQNDIEPMRRLFPEIKLISPVVREWVTRVEYGGRSYDQASILGVSPEYFAITNRQLIAGHLFTRYHTRNHRGVCVIGYDVARRLFNKASPLNQMIQIVAQSDRQYSCLVIGVLKSQTSNNEWFNPNSHLIVPESYLSIMAARWYSKPNEFNITIESGRSIDDLVTKIKQFFFMKYGRTADVNVNSDEILVAQMRRFLNLFAVLLAGVAFISLAVGGIGITNMMLVSVAERFKEIGLRKALGARDKEIRLQFLMESLILCAIAGFAGVIVGTLGYEALLYLASKLFPKVQFEWVFNVPAILLSVACVFTVGLASGLVPAIRAEKLEVVEALRSE